MNREIGHETQPGLTQHLLQIDSDTSSLVPEMMDKLFSGHALRLQFEPGDPIKSFRLHDYIRDAAGEEELATALEACVLDRDNKVSHFNAIRTALIASVRAQCERETDYYAAALRLETSHE